MKAFISSGLAAVFLIALTCVLFELQQATVGNDPLSIIHFASPTTVSTQQTSASSTLSYGISRLEAVLRSDRLCVLNGVGVGVHLTIVYLADEENITLEDGSDQCIEHVHRPIQVEVHVSSDGVLTSTWTQTAALSGFAFLPTTVQIVPPAGVAVISVSNHSHNPITEITIGRDKSRIDIPPDSTYHVLGLHAVHDDAIALTSSNWTWTWKPDDVEIERVGHHFAVYLEADE